MNLCKVIGSSGVPCFFIGLRFAPQTQSEMGDPQQAAYVPIPASDSFSNDLSSAYQPPAFSDYAPSAPGDDIINPPGRDPRVLMAGVLTTFQIDDITQYSQLIWD